MRWPGIRGAAPVRVRRAARGWFFFSKRVEMRAVSRVLFSKRVETRAARLASVLVSASDDGALRLWSARGDDAVLLAADDDDDNDDDDDE